MQVVAGGVDDTEHRWSKGLQTYNENVLGLKQRGSCKLIYA